MKLRKDSADKGAGSGCMARLVRLSSFVDEGKYCANVLFCDMETRRGFIELLEKIEPCVKEEIIQHWGELIAVVMREVMQSDPTQESGMKSAARQKQPDHHEPVESHEAP